MAYLRNTPGVGEPSNSTSGNKFYKKKWFKIAAPIILVLVIVGGIFFWKADSVLNKITKGGLLNSIGHSLPGVAQQMKGEKEDRVNILLLGMRGANDPSGGLLSDTIQVLSIEPKANKASLISIPRDLYVDNPATGSKSKLNAVHAYGEQKGPGQGMTYMEQEVGTITGLPIQYAVTVNFDAFNQLLTAIGGITITLDKPFEESAQFNQLGVCDANTFTIKTGQFQNKVIKSHTVVVNGVKKKVSIKAPMYPLCSNAHPECNGDFKLPAGQQTLTAEQALCYARSRDNTNDFQRAQRQQQVMQAIKDKLLSVGTLTDFGKLNGIMSSLGDNVKTDMQPWELKRLYDLYGEMKGYTMYNRVIDSTDDPEVGLVYGVQDPTAGDILMPKGDNYDKIQSLFQNIFTLSPQPAKSQSN
jgi:LCP family protein required for cell wall assembly